MTLKQEDILRIAMEQSAKDINCSAEDFLHTENVIVKSELKPGARKYYREPIACNLVSYGNNIVASTKEEYHRIVETYIGSFPYFHCFETPNMHWLDEHLAAYGQRICFMAEYFLPDIGKLEALSDSFGTDVLPVSRKTAVPPDSCKIDVLPCGFELKLLMPPDFTALYTPQWSNALCADRKELDVLAAAAYDHDKLVGLAGCSMDCDTMWQIGVDVLPEYRRMGIASALTARLALKILDRGKVPFYCAAWSNIRSVRNALKSGFLPAWVEMTAKPQSMIDEMNAAASIKR